MKVFLDTNVLLSAMLTRGICSQVLGRCLERHDMLISETVLEEFRRKAIGKLKAPLPEVEERVSYLREYAVIVEEPKVVPRRSRDPKDDPILAAALSAKSDCLVTGDKDLLALAGRFPTAIIPPGRFFAFEAGQP